MRKLSCDGLHGRMQHICQGRDADGMPIDMAPETRLFYLRQFFPDESEESLLALLQNNHVAEQRPRIRGLGDLAAIGIKLATLGLVEPCGACKERQKRWNGIRVKDIVTSIFAPFFGVGEKPISEATRRNLCMHIWPTRNGAWEWNVEQILQRWDVFTGRKRIAVVESDQTVSLDRVVQAFGGRDIEVFAMPNNPRIREGQTFQRLLEPLSEDRDAITFYCHAKGARHGESYSSIGSQIQRWTEIMYWANLDRMPMILEQLKTSAMTGAFRRFGQFRTPGNHRWHYSGSFYWFRHADVFSQNWRRLDRLFFAVESWPGLMFRPEQVACNFLDDCGDLYKGEFWQQRVLPELMEAGYGRGVDFPVAW